MDTTSNNNRESFDDQQVIFVDTGLIQRAVEGLQKSREEFRALLERAERLDRAVGQARRGDTAVRSTGSPTGGTALSGLAVRQSGGWLERGEDHAAAVDRAFQRDSRRYDQGFALY